MRRLGVVLALVVGCGPERAVGIDGDGCAGILPLGEPQVGDLSGPDGGPCRTGQSDLCLTLFEYLYSPEASEFSLEPGDLDGDGLLDAVLHHTARTAEDAPNEACAGRAYVRVLLGSSDGGLTDGPAMALPGSRTPLAVSDLSGDGRDEIVLATDGEAGTHHLVILGITDGRLVERALLDFGDRRPTSIRIGDFDGVGLLDLAITFAPHCSGDSCGLCTPSAEIVLDPLDTIMRVRLTVNGTTFGGGFVARGLDGLDRFWARRDGGDCSDDGGEEVISSHMVVGRREIVLEHEVPTVPRTSSMAVDLDGDGASELLFGGSPNTLWSLTEDGEGYARREELPAGWLRGIGRFRSGETERLHLFMQRDGSSRAERPLDLWSFDETAQVFEDFPALTLPVSAATSFSTRAITSVLSHVVLTVSDDDGSRFLWVLSQQE